MYFCTRFEKHVYHVTWGEKQKEHVPRHIELTAVLREILEQRIKSNRIERFEKTTRPSVKIKKRQIYLFRIIYDEEFDPGSG